MIATLRDRNFALLWFAGLISLAGDWMLRIALPLHVYQETGSTLATGAMFMAGILPSLLLGTVAGMLVDRWDRRRTMVAANLARALILLPLLLVRSGDLLWVVYVVAAAESAIGLFFGPAENALLPRLVREDRLVSANSLNALNNNLARLVGPPLGGALAAFAGLGGVAVADSLTYLVGGALIALMRVPATPAREVEGAGEVASAWARAWREWRQGLRLVRGEPTLRVLFAVAAAAALGEGILGALFVPFATEVLEGGELYLGWLMTAQAVGGLLGGVLIGKFGNHVPPRRLLGVSAIVFGLGDLAMFNARSLETHAVPALTLALAMILLVGVPATGFGAGFLTLMQAGTQDEYRGRVFGALATTEALLLIAGLALAGVLGDVVGIVPLLSVDSALYVLAGVLALTLLPRAVRGRALVPERA